MHSIVYGALPEHVLLFAGGVAKWVRRGHVQTDQHWLHQTVVPQRLL